MVIFNIGNKILNIKIFRSRGTFGTFLSNIEQGKGMWYSQQLGSWGKSYHKQAQG